MRSTYRNACAELASIADHLSEDSVETACQLIANARHNMLFGCGREGLQMQGFAMRLHHLGRSVSMQGDIAAPPLGKGDLFVTSAGPGVLSTVNALAKTATEAGAQVLFLTAVPDAPLAALADHTLLIPAQTMATDRNATSTLPMGSLYEAALFVLFEIMVLRLAEILAETPATMRGRHTNME